MPDVFANYSTWLHTLPLWSQPVIATAIPCFPVLLLLTIRHRVNLHRKGERFTAHKTKPAEYLGLAAVFAALYYAHHHYPLAAQILTWPDRTFPLWHRHGGAMTVGFMAAGMAARALSAMYAALFLRGGHSRGGSGIGISTGRHTLLPNPPDGFGWFSPPAATRTRIVSRRTFHTDEED